MNGRLLDSILGQLRVVGVGRALDVATLAEFCCDRYQSVLPQ